MTEVRTVTLTEFLLARIAEDEGRAKMSYRLRSDVSPFDHFEIAPGVHRVNGENYTAREMLERFYEPAPDARVLAECEAKRRIVEWCGEREQVYVGTIADADREPTPDMFVPGALRNPADAVVLRFLALPYADHPDYRQEWRP